MLGDNHGRRVNSQIQTIKHLVGSIDKVELVGPLACHLRDESASPYVQALIRLLPKVEITDGYLLDRRERGYLNWALMGGNRELVLAILDMLRKIGDHTAIRNVSKLAAGKGLAADYPDIKESAIGCLLVLEARSEIQDADQKEEQSLASLLRPMSPGDNEANLMRSAGLSVSEIATDQLLKPVEPNSLCDPEELSL
jgi:hypothetical protein